MSRRAATTLGEIKPAPGPQRLMAIGTHPYVKVQSRESQGAHGCGRRAPRGETCGRHRVRLLRRAHGIGGQAATAICAHAGDVPARAPGAEPLGLAVFQPEARRCVGYGHHLRADPRWLVASRGRARHAHPTDRGLGDGRARGSDISPAPHCGWRSNVAGRCRLARSITATREASTPAAPIRPSLQSSRPAAEHEPQGDAYDNCRCFFSSLKQELTHHERSFADLDEARGKLFDYIEVFYNRQRLHSSLAINAS